MLKEVERQEHLISQNLRHLEQKLGKIWRFRQKVTLTIDASLVASQRQLAEAVESAKNKQSEMDHLFSTLER